MRWILWFKHGECWYTLANGTTGSGRMYHTAVYVTTEEWHWKLGETLVRHHGKKILGAKPDRCHKWISWFRISQDLEEGQEKNNRECQKQDLLWHQRQKEYITEGNGNNVWAFGLWIQLNLSIPSIIWLILSLWESDSINVLFITLLLTQRNTKSFPYLWDVIFLDQKIIIDIPDKCYKHVNNLAVV